MTRYMVKDTIGVYMSKDNAHKLCRLLNTGLMSLEW